MTKSKFICPNELLGGSLIGLWVKSREIRIQVERVRSNLEFGGMRNMAF
jgi:hypothetical protein